MSDELLTLVTHHSLLLFHNPLIGGAGVADQFFGFEEDRDFTGGAFEAIGSVDQIAPNFDGEIAPNSAGSGVGRVGRADGIADGFDGFLAFKNGDDDGGTGDVADQSLEEGFADVFGVVGLGQFVRDLHQFHANDFQAAPFQAVDNFADQAALYTIRLNNYESSFQSFKFSSLKS